MFKKIKQTVFSLFFGLGIIFTANVLVQAQPGQAGEILRAGKSDANILLKNYIAPFAKGFGANLNTGWFNKASSHKTLGFELSLNVTAAVVPNADQIMDLNTLLPQFSKLEYVSGNMEAPTVSGENTSNTELGIYYTNPATNQEELLTSFTTPEGTGFPYVPAPMVQASLGIIKDTDVTLRYIPEISIPGLDEDEAGKINLFGFGVKHGINQWIPGDKLIPIDLSVQFGYTNFASNIDFDIRPQVDNDTKNEFPESTWNGQALELETNSSTFNVIAGKSIPLLSVYGGIGFENSKTTIVTPGSYPVTTPNTEYDPSASSGDPNSNTKKIVKVDQPIDVEIEGANSLRLFGGFRFKLALVHISASYTQSNYSSFKIGAGFSFR